MAATGFAASAHAADLSVDSLKDPLPEKISYAGVTLYGTVDVGYGYQEHGYAFSDYWINAQNYQPLKALQGSAPLNPSLAQLPSRSVLNNNALSTSTIGVKVEENIGAGFVAIAKLETGFNPLSGELGNGAASLQQQSILKAAGQPYSSWVASSDSARNGQFLNGEAYGGVSSSTYGTLTFGRQDSLLRSAVKSYDPLAGSAAFSLVGNTGTIVQGAGDTEASVWDNSLKYVYQYGPAHAAVQYSNGGNGTALLGWGVGANAGVTYKGVSVDGYYTKENAAVNLDSAIAGGTAPNFFIQNAFKYTVSNNEAWGAGAKYSFDLGGGFKDESTSKVTFFGGFVSVTSTNPDNSQASYAGNSAGGGYALTTASYTTAYVTDRVIQTAWVGATYETGPWAFTGAYYHENQNDFQTAGGSGTLSPTVWGGNLDWVSGVVDYKFNKHFDVYAGVSWLDWSGHWASGQSTTQDINVNTGVRLKF